MADKKYNLVLTMSDGTKKTMPLIVPQGEKGEKGDQGIQGIQGIQGAKGDTGATGAAGSNGKDGTNGVSATHSWNGTTLTITSASGTSSANLKGEKGDKGETGAQGATGATGAKGDKGDKGADGVNYYSLTDTDKEAIVQQVIVALGTPVFGTVDADNNITLTGKLVKGTYTLRYEDEEGKVTNIGTLATDEVDNLAEPTSADWLPNKRLNSSGSPTETHSYQNTGGAVTNFIPCEVGDVIRVKGLKVSHYWTNQTEEGRATAFFYAENKSTIIAKNVPADGNGWVYANGIWTYTVGTSLTAVSGNSADIRWARLTGRYYDGYTANDVIITVNEEI